MEAEGEGRGSGGRRGATTLGWGRALTGGSGGVGATSGGESRRQNRVAARATAARGCGRGVFSQRRGENLQRGGTPSGEGSPDLGMWDGPLSQPRGVGNNNPNDEASNLVDARKNSGGVGAKGARGGRRRQRGCALLDDDFVKGKNFFPEEECQLTRSVMAISQDPICGNLQKSSAFWERIFVHYDGKRPGGFRRARSLESKWGIIKQDVNKFIGNYQEIKNMHKSGTTKADIVRMAKELYRSKSDKCTDFMFEHCWLLVKKFPKWADGWSPSRQSILSKRKSHACDQQSQSITTEFMRSVGDVGEANEAFGERPGGTKVAKDAQKASYIMEKHCMAQTKIAEAMAESSHRRAIGLEEQNMLLLMGSTDAPEAQEYLRLIACEELKKLKRRMADDVQREICEKEAHERSEQLQLEKKRVAADVEARKAAETGRQMRDARSEFGEDEGEDNFNIDNEDNLEGEETVAGLGTGNCEDFAHVDPGMPTTWRVLGCDTYTQREED